ncbi:MAG: (d)CMP kinase, partial [Candidatus Nanopelagicales bacterium]
MDANRAVVAIDGPSGSGKSSTSRGVAIALGLDYLDTGAMYRAMAWFMLDRGVDVADPAAIAARADEPTLTSTIDPDAPTIAVDAHDVSAAIRDEAVTGAVSPVAAVPEVRTRLVDLQREIVAATQAAGRGIVVEGRDIGTVVLPDATAKIYLTADAQARAARRAVQDADRAG